jgi:hypothetical protein
MSGVSWNVPGEYWYRRHWDSSDILDPACPRNRRGALHWVGRVNNQPNEYGCESFSSITDGASNTLLIGEYATRTAPRRTSFWAYPFTYFTLSCMTPDSRTLVPDFERCVSQGDASPCKRGFGSLHAGGVIQFAKCDGSIAPVSPIIDRSVYWALSTIAGGEPVLMME